LTVALPRIRRDVRDALAVYGYLLLSAQQTEKAHAVFKGMRVLLPDDPHVARSLAMTSLATGDAAAALALADQARTQAAEEDLAAIDALRGKALFALGRLDEARAALGQSLTRRAGPLPGVNGSAPTPAKPAKTKSLFRR
jgi:tetratricopeptide (TPR) repeat protein